MRMLMVVLACVVPCSALAAGFQSLEQGTDEIGRAMVGAASWANSAATSYYNPAGMTELSQPEVQGGLMGILGRGEFDPDSSNTVPGSEGGNQLGNVVAPGGLFYVHPVNDKISVGFSGVAPFVGSIDPGNDWVGRYYVRSFDLSVYAGGPSIAYEINDQLSIGVQGFLVYGKADIKAALNVPLTPIDDQLHIDSADQWASQFGAGLLWKPTEKTRVGVAYKSEIDLDSLRGDVTVSGTGPGVASSVKLGFTLPQSANLSVAHELSDDLTLFADYGWADFSEFDMVSIDGSTVNPRLETSFQDTVGYGVAARYRLNPEWTLQGGVSYASSPVSNSKRIPALPFDRQVRYGAGAVYQWSEDIEVALSYEFMDLRDAKINATQLDGLVVSGDYDPNHVQFIALSLRKLF